MKKPNRIGLSLFDEELLSLINASAKIFPLAQEDIDNNINIMSYEYARVGNHIYRWANDKWSYIITDDADIDWSDIKNKPTAYVPLPHDHDRLHEHANKTLLDRIKETDVNLWNTVSSKSNEGHTHNYSSEGHVHDDRYYTESEIDLKLNNTSPSSHNHDGRYYQKYEVDTKLGNKSDIDHTHDFESSEHGKNMDIHVTLEDKENWNNKSPFKYEDEFLELRDHYGYMPINGGGFDGSDGYYLMYDGGTF